MFIVGASFRQLTRPPINLWPKFNLSKNDSFSKQKKSSKKNAISKRNNNNSNRCRRSSKDSLPLKKKKWYPFIKIICNKNKDKSQLWKTKLSTIKKPWNSIILNSRDCKRNFKIIRKSSLFRKKKNFNRKNKKKHKKITLKSFFQIKDLQEEDLTWLFDCITYRLISHIFIYHHALVEYL